ncbi:lipocalin-like domain-containing protein [Roseomonas soli]|uniref:Lipocalin-like domain-containing protein n=1 Tax=Neoroseomonas soli TaxID=1081025 RepID=A0A9X9WT46_9PROT|nr:lipocalin-like domain-containing protein [Neoroseomonas soli]
MARHPLERAGGEEVAVASHPLVGAWRSDSREVIANSVPREIFGARPERWLILTLEGRTMALTAAEDRAPGESEAERAALHRSMLASTGRYRVEGDRFATTLKASLTAAWNGTVAALRHRGDGLSIRPGAEHPLPRPHRSPADRLGAGGMTPQRPRAAAGRSTRRKRCQRHSGR